MGGQRTADPEYLLVLDFEATCQRAGVPQPQEVIEFPAVLWNTRTLEIAEFHRYVRPEAHPQLTKFCTGLTGIAQEQVDAAAPLGECLERFHEWLHARGLLRTRADGAVERACDWLLVTAGDWDLGVLLPRQCKAQGLRRPEYLRAWCDLNVVFREVEGERLRRMLGVAPVRSTGPSMLGMLRWLGIPHTGRHHSGIDDARNILKICVVLAHAGGAFRVTSERAGPSG